jgi:hypothetical protein
LPTSASGPSCSFLRLTDVMLQLICTIMCDVMVPRTLLLLGYNSLWNTCQSHGPVLKTEATSFFSENMITTNKITWRHNPEEHAGHVHRRQNLEFLVYY